MTRPVESGTVVSAPLGGDQVASTNRAPDPAPVATHSAARSAPRRTLGVWKVTVRLRLTLLYGGLFVLSGAALLTITYLLVLHFTDQVQITTTPTGGSPLNDAPTKASTEVVSQLHNAYLDRLLTQSEVALAIMTVVSAWLGWVMAGRVLRPVRVMTETTRRISQENLHQRLALPGPRDELTDLGETIDALLARLEATFDAQRRFVANASHELRTPLAMMRTSLDVAEGKPPPVSPAVTVLAAKIREGLNQADRLIESFLALARAYESQAPTDTTVDLAEIVADAVTGHQRHAAELDVDLHRALSPVTVVGHPTLLRRLVDNLLDNALRYNHRGGTVDVKLSSGDPRRASLVVENTGQQLDAADIEQLGQPFRRLGPERTTTTGVGLGLSIVTAIARLHSGDVQLSPRAGGGLRVHVDLPTSNPARPQ